MGLEGSFHAPDGAADFLGWRQRQGTTEIIYDDGGARRIIWRAEGADLSPARLSEALREAVSKPRILTSLYEELKKRAIGIEKING